MPDQHQQTDIRVERHTSDTSIGHSPFRRVKWDWTISLGAVIQLGGVLSVGLGLFAYGLRFQYATEAGLAENLAARLKYIPIIEGLQKSDDAQNYRLEAANDALSEIRKLQSDNSKQLAEIATDIAVIKERISRDKMP